MPLNVKPPYPGGRWWFDPTGMIYVDGKVMLMIAAPSAKAAAASVGAVVAQGASDIGGSVQEAGSDIYDGVAAVARHINDLFPTFPPFGGTPSPRRGH